MVYNIEQFNCIYRCKSCHLLCELYKIIHTEELMEGFLRLQFIFSFPLPWARIKARYKFGSFFGKEKM